MSKNKKKGKWRVAEARTFSVASVQIYIPFAVHCFSVLTTYGITVSQGPWQLRSLWDCGIIVSLLLAKGALKSLCHRKFGSINSKLQRAVGHMANGHMRPEDQCTNILLEDFHPEYDNQTAHQGELGTSPIFRGFSVVWHVWSGKLGKLGVAYN